MNIRLRLALGMALVTALVVVVVAGVQFLALRSFLSLSEHERLEMLVPTLETSLEAQLRSGTAPLKLTALPRNVDIRVLSAGKIVAQTNNFPAIALTESLGYRPLAKHNVLIASMDLSGQPATAQLASDLLGVLNPLRAYLRALAITVPTATLLVALLSFAFTGRLLRPLAQLEAVAARLGREGNLRLALPGAGQPDELGRLARTLQVTFAQLADLREREAEFTQAAAHDLRSPLAALKTRLQGALAGPRTPIELREDIGEALSDIERMRRLTDDLLLLAGGEREVQTLPLSLAHLTGEVVDRLRERTPDVQLDFETRGDTTVLGDATLLTHLVENLIENGFRHGQGADMQVCVVGESELVRLEVSDAGPGVPSAALPRLAEPFYRVDAARVGEGNGLGLAIVHRAAKVHAAELSFENSQPSGLKVVVEFRRGEPRL
ncbi:sensor histidine kinase (plasmid) [Deinococcus psychrotolerans]|uniref:histidine kinase n=1 Tax=Deinococcus psychrotolerans TaxID=2489213 RepID=A0A3G8YTD6_9DEIO|nr:HAMP domain-containing sensor histidine kinase [Deinococcus psychrotolerans]AZI44516.1 sensor histidine kinase [Deinococcus psychrotolerans]